MGATDGAVVLFSVEGGVSRGREKYGKKEGVNVGMGR